MNFGAAARWIRSRYCGFMLLAGGLVLCGGLTWLSWRPAAMQEQAVPFVALYGLQFGVFLLGLLWLKSCGMQARTCAMSIVAAAVLLRLALAPAPPLLDDDIYRYRWDGKVLAHGLNPYAFPPDAPELTHLSQGDPLFERTAFRDVPAVYPPLSELLFAAGYAVIPSGIWAIKALIVGFDVLAVVGILGLLRALGRRPEAAAIYAWNPLVLKEFANTGHHDAIGIAFLVLALWSLVSGRRVWASVALAAAALVKPIVLLLAPGLIGRLRARDWFLLCAIFATAYGLFSGIGLQRLFAGLRIYTLHWEMNDSLFALLQAGFGGPAPSSTPGFLFETNPTARAAALALWLSVAGWVLLDYLRERRGLKLRFGPTEGGTLRSFWRMAILLTAALALTPTMDPWYLCWLVPFLCLFTWEAGILMTGTVGISYLYYWQMRDLPWLRPVEYLPVVLWAIWESRRRRGTLPRASDGWGQQAG